MSAKTISISIGVGAIIGGAIGIISYKILRDRYAQYSLEEIDRETAKLEKKCSEYRNLSNYAIRQVYELRDALSMMVADIQYDTILAQVDYKFSELAKNKRNKPMLDSKELFDQALTSVHNTWHETPITATERVATEAFIQDLGYAQTDDEPMRRERGNRHRTYEDKPDLMEIAMIRRKAYMEVYEQQQAEEEYPYEEPGSEKMDPDDEYEDGKPLVDRGVESEYAESPYPYIISEDDYVYSDTGYEKAAITYYGADDYLIDEDETIMEQWVIGPRNLKEFEKTEHPAIFIRNDQIEMEYEVLWEDGSYQRDYCDVPEAEISGKRIWRPWEKR